MVTHSIATVFTAALCASAALAAALEGQYVEAGLAPREVRDSSSWPHGPFRTDGRDIVNARGDKIKWAGVNWPMSGETMVPEGLEKRSAEEILDEVASLGMNFLRMGYSAQMVDEEAESDQGADVPLEAAMIKALGYHNGTRVTSAIVERNPQWTRRTGRFEIWSGIARLAAERGIYVHPDMHITTAGWCCGHDDGSAWFGDEGFSVGNWTRALGRVAEWAAGHPNVVSMSLVNELRRPWGSEGGKSGTDSDDEKKNDPSRFEYNWLSLVGNMTLGADAVHAANPDLLISWSGLQFDEDLSALTSGLDLNSAPCYMCAAVRDAPRRQPKVFDLADHAWGDKVFYELHLYPMSEDLDVGTCGVIKAQLYRAGFNALGMPPPADCSLLETSPLGPCRPASRLTPVAMTEFGASQDETLLGNPYVECLREFTTENDVSWAVWALAGSYRIRSGAQGVDDGWALMNFGWDGWRFEDGIEQIWKPWVKETNATAKN